MEAICEKFNLLSEKNDIVRVPFLVKGCIETPPEVEEQEIRDAFKNKDTNVATLSNAQVVREPVIDRYSMTYTGDFTYHVMPKIDPGALIESNIEDLVSGLYALPISEILRYLQSLSDMLVVNQGLRNRVRDFSRKTAEHPDPYHDAAYDAFPLLLNPEQAETTIDAELSAWGKPGREFLNGWVEAPSTPFPGMAWVVGQPLIKEGQFGGSHAGKAMIRAMPTRQLHITAGNAPAIPIISTLRAILTKSAGVIKSPYGAILPGAFMALVAVAAEPDHPITKNLSIVYWPGGDERIENTFFSPGAFDRIVVWGAPDAVESVQSRAKFTRTVCFNPRYGFSFIGKEAFSENLQEVAVRASFDAMIWNQKACIASQVQYVEGSVAQAEEYARVLRDVLSKWDTIAPNFMSPSTRGMLKRMKRGKYMNATWYVNYMNKDVSSGVVVISDEFDILDHPMCRLIVIRPVDNLKETFKYLHHGVSSVGIYPEKRRIELRDAILAHGVTNVLLLGQVEHMFGGMPHDGMMVLNELVDWKNA